MSAVLPPTVCLFLCPYRNLTTLTSAVLALHDHVQVMNHGIERLAAAGALDFVTEPAGAGLDAFARAAVELSATGQRGAYGGSITLSHAFDHPEVRQGYTGRFGDAPVKPDIRAVVWKEGGLLRQYLLDRGVDVPALAGRLDRLRFLAPIRQPIDHVYSLRKFYGKGPSDLIVPEIADLSFEGLAAYVLRCHHDFLTWRRARPDRFLAFTEAEIGPDLLVRLAGFLGVEPRPAWLEAAAAAFRSKVHYAPAAEDRELFARLLRARHGDDPEFVDLMLGA